MKKKKQTTNAMRMLDKAGIEYEAIEYETDGEVGEDFGKKIAALTGLDEKISFKTLVVRTNGGFAAACIPVADELDLKKLAAAAGEKRAELIHVKELQGLTGYIRGGVSPIGMKKQFPTFIHESAQMCDKIAVSGGVCGITLLMKPSDVLKACSAKFADITRKE